MKKTLVRAAVLTSALAVSAVYGATLDFLQKSDSSKVYLGLMLNNGDIKDVEGVGQDMSLFSATLGYRLLPRVSVEGRFGAGSDELSSLMQDPVSTYVAGLVRYQYTWDSKIMAYASVGAGVRRHSSVLDIDDQDQAGLALAFGINLFGNKNTAVNIEYFAIGGDQLYSSIGIGFR